MLHQVLRKCNATVSLDSGHQWLDKMFIFRHQSHIRDHYLYKQKSLFQKCSQIVLKILSFSSSFNYCKNLMVFVKSLTKLCLFSDLKMLFILLVAVVSNLNQVLKIMSKTFGKSTSNKTRQKFLKVVRHWKSKVNWRGKLIDVKSWLTRKVDWQKMSTDEESSWIRVLLMDACM